MKKIYFTVTNDLTYDQRMARICGSLVKAGYSVMLIGRKSNKSVNLDFRSYKQTRLNCIFQKGKFFYIEFNLRLFFYLLFKKMDVICCIDLDTILPCLYISKLKRIKRVYDAHELFCEMKEVVTRPFIYRCWKIIEKMSVPKFRFGYTVSQPIAEEFKKMYAVEYEVIRNIPVLDESFKPSQKNKYILYQGAVNEGRSFETLIPAMKQIQVPLIICGDGNFMEQAIRLVEQYGLGKKIIFKGALPPAELLNYTRNATLGITLFEPVGKSNYYSLANRFFDYLHACVPQLCVDYPAYRQINEQFKVAILTDDLSAEGIADALNNLLNNDVLYKALLFNCVKAKEVYNWQQEEKKLTRFYQQLLS